MSGANERRHRYEMMCFRNNSMCMVTCEEIFVLTFIITEKNRLLQKVDISTWNPSPFKPYMKVKVDLALIIMN